LTAYIILEFIALVKPTVWLDALDKGIARLGQFATEDYIKSDNINNRLEDGGPEQGFFIDIFVGF
jgi:hypothetical protein